MKKEDIDKVTHADVSVTPSSVTGFLEGDEAVKPDSLVSRFRKVTDNLYECLVTDITCLNRFHFGTKVFCTWLLKDGTDNSKHNLPCSQEDQTKKTDD